MTKSTRQLDDLGRFLTGTRRGLSHVDLPAERAVYTQGDSADSLFYVERGWVKLTVVTPNGKEPVIALRHHGELFGTRCLADRARMATATTLTSCALKRVSKPALLRMMREVPAFAEAFVAHLVRKAMRDQESLVDQLTNSAERRLARALLGLADGEDHGDAASVPTRLNQAVLASMIGTTRSRVSFFMNKFKRQGLIAYDRQGHLSVRKAPLSALLQK